MVDDFAQYARRGRNGPVRYGLALALGLVLSVVLGAAVLLPLQLAGLLPVDLATRMTDASAPEVFFPATGVMFGCLLLGCVLAARWVQGKRLRDIVGAWRWRLFGLGLALWTLVLVAGAGADALLAPEGFSFTATPQTLSVAGLALVALVPQVFAEEFIFRGWITQGLLLALKRPWPTAIVSGIVFGSVHIPNGLPQAASATLFGVLTAVIAIRLGGIAFTTGLHLANNLFGAVIVVSAQDVFRGLSGVIRQSTPQLMWWDVAVSAAGLTCLTFVVLKLTSSRTAADGSSGDRALGVS